MVERVNRTMGKYLYKVVTEHQQDWEQYLHLFLMAYRSSVNETTGQTPVCIMFGSIPSESNVAGEDYISHLKKRLNDIHDLVRENIQIASD